MHEHYEAANKYLSAGDQTSAELESKAFLGEALHRVANGEAQAGQFATAFPLFEQALAFLPSDNDLRLDFASACLDADKLTRARVLAEEAVHSDARNARARLLLGRVLYNLEDYQEAKTQLEAAVATNSDFPTGYLLGKTYLLLHDEKAARALFDEMVAGLGDTPLIHIYFGRAYSLMDYPEQAVQEFHKAILKDSHARDAHYYLALAFLRHDETAGYAKAIPEFRAELNVNPGDVRSRYMLGYIALRQRNFSEAEAQLVQAGALQPRDLNTLVSLAEVYMGENREVDAETALRKAIATAQTLRDDLHQAARAHYLLGRLLMKSGRAEEGKRELSKSAESDGSSGKDAVTVGEARTINSGSLVQEESRADRTEVKPAPHEELEKLEQFKKLLNPLIGEAYNNLGVIAASQHDFKAATASFENAAVWNPRLSGIDRNLGMAAYYAGEYGKASQFLQRYLAEHPDDPAVRSAYDETVKKLASQKDAPRPN